MHTMNEFELKSHAEYATKYPEYEVSFFEAMIIPPWAHNIFGATNHTNEDLLNIILAYKQAEIINHILDLSHPIIIILLYNRLLVFKKLLLSLEPEESANKIEDIKSILKELSVRYPCLFDDELLSEKDLQTLLTILHFSRKLDSDLHDPYMRFSKIKKLLAAFYQAITKRILDENPSEIAIIACFISSYFQNPGDGNKKIKKAAKEVFNYIKQRNEWITESPRLALFVIDKSASSKLRLDTQNALYEAALKFGDVAFALENKSELLNLYATHEQQEIHHEAQGFKEEVLNASLVKSESKPYQLNKRQYKEISRQALKMYHCLYRQSKRLFSRGVLRMTSNHLRDILTIIINNEKDILPIIADYWHKTFRQFKVHSQSAKFQKKFQDYVEIIINFFNDKDIGAKDDAKLKLFAQEFILLCKTEKEKNEYQSKLSKHFERTLDGFIDS